MQITKTLAAIAGFLALASASPVDADVAQDMAATGKDKPRLNLDPADGYCFADKGFGYIQFQVGGGNWSSGAGNAHRLREAVQKCGTITKWEYDVQAGMLFSVLSTHLPVFRSGLFPGEQDGLTLVLQRMLAGPLSSASRSAQRLVSPSKLSPARAWMAATSALRTWHGLAAVPLLLS